MEFLRQLRPILTGKQIERLANIFDNAGQVVFAIMVLSPLISGFESINRPVIMTGIGLMIICWTTSILLARRE